MKRFRAELVLLAIALVWGSSFSLMRNVIDYLPEIPYLALRFLIGAAALLILFRKRLKGLTVKICVQGAVIGLTLFLGMVLQVYGLRYTSATNSAFITGLNFVFVPVISAVLLKKRPSRLMVLGVGIAAAGLMLITGGLDTAPNRGDVLTLICSVCWAMQIIVIDKFAGESDPVLLGVTQVVITALFFLVAWGAVDRTPIALSSPFVWVVLLITGLGGTAFAFAAQTVVQRDISPTQTAVIFSMEPVFGMLFALVIPDVDGVREAMTLIKAAGCALIFTGMLLCEFGGKKPQAPPNPAGRAM